MDRDEERRIIDSILAGNTQEFEVFVLQHQTQIYNLALKMVGNEQDAYDLTQDAFIRAYNSLDNFRGDSKFSVWLYRLASNICLDFLRVRRRKNFVSLTYLVSDDSEELELEIPDERYCPHTELEKRELREAVRRGLTLLPDDQREILVLREVSGMSYDEIAAVLTLEPGTVKSRIFRARRKLCNILARDGNFSEFNPSKKAKGGVSLG